MKFARDPLLSLFCMSFDHRARAYGMEVSTGKSKFITNSTNNISVDISMNGQKVEDLTSF